MPAATNKTDLIAACEAEFEKLRTLIDTLDDETALAPRDEGISIKDVVGHRAHWIDLWLGWDADGRAGRAVHMPAEGYKWSELKPYNARVREQQSDLSWHEARLLLGDRHKALMGQLESLSEDDLYGHPMPGGNGKWTAGRYAESAGSSHYRSALKVIRGWLRSG